MRLYHGTDVDSVLGLLNGDGLDATIASARHVNGAPGFYLATEEGDTGGFVPLDREPSNGSEVVAPIEPLSALRAHPEWYFQSGEFERATVTALLIIEAASSDRVTSARFESDGEWTAVTADGDWLAGDLRAFSTPTPFPESGVNTIRVEILLTAFCDTVVTAAGGRRDDLNSARSREMPESMSRALMDANAGRVMVFRSPGAEQSGGSVLPFSNDIFSPSSLQESKDRLERAYA